MRNELKSAVVLIKWLLFKFVSKFQSAFGNYELSTAVGESVIRESVNFADDHAVLVFCL